MSPTEASGKEASHRAESFPSFPTFPSFMYTDDAPPSVDSRTNLHPSEPSPYLGR
jgi:hypothetical protein